jgi:hypothetical protein
MQTQHFIRILLLLILWNCSQSGYAQSASIVSLNRDSFSAKIEVLRAEFGQNKVIPPAVELECLTALQYYPELKTTHIIFRFGKAKTTMSSRPAASSLLHNKTKRTYIVTINEDGASTLGLKWSELSFNETVGWLGHELGHILHYSQKTNIGILSMGYQYLFPNYKRKMERFTDQLAIQHNLGFALYAGTEYTLNCSKAKKSYRKNTLRFYLKPGEILQKTYQKERYTANFRKTRFNRASKGLASLK